MGDVSLGELPIAAAPLDRLSGESGPPVVCPTAPTLFPLEGWSGGATLQGESLTGRSPLQCSSHQAGSPGGEPAGLAKSAGGAWQVRGALYLQPLGDAAL